MRERKNLGACADADTEYTRVRWCIFEHEANEKVHILRNGCELLVALVIGICGIGEMVDYGIFRSWGLRHCTR